MSASSAVQLRMRSVSKAAPFRTGGVVGGDIVRAWVVASGIVAVSGCLLFGPAAAGVLGAAVLTAIGADRAMAVVLRRPVAGGLRHAGLMGLLLGLTLPATVPWHVAVIGSIVAIVVGKWMFGGMGNYVWQPALVGRVVVQFLFSQTLSLSGSNALWPILAPGHLLVGNLANAKNVESGGYQGWWSTGRSWDADALLVARPVQALRRLADGRMPRDDRLVLTPVLRDSLPPWEDTLLGVVPGGIGETSTLALLVAGLYLIHRGFLNWQLPLAVVAGAALAASILPFKTGGEEGRYLWLPLFLSEAGRAVGLAYVMYHLTAGQLMLGAMLLAGDMMSTPLRARGQWVFGAGVGAITLFMRLYGVLEGECYWAILIMNTVVVVIDKQMKRSVLGTTPAPA